MDFLLQNTDQSEAISIEDVDSTFYITREGDFVRAGLEYVDEAEIFEGNENKITMLQTYNKRFHCTYLLQNFPFDKQASLFHRCLQKLVKVQ